MTEEETIFPSGEPTPGPPPSKAMRIVGALIVALVLIPYFAMMAFSLASIPCLAGPGMGFLVACGFILPCRLVPRKHRKAATAIMGILGIVTASLIPLTTEAAVILGGAVSVCIVVGRRPASREECYVTVLFMLFYYPLIPAFQDQAKFIDWPGDMDPLPVELARMLHSQSGYREYRLSSFSSWYTGKLWQVNIDAEKMARLEEGLNLKQVNEAPPGFFRLPPCYWPRSLPERGVLYESFPAPKDSSKLPGMLTGLLEKLPTLPGVTTFVLYDSEKQRAYVWERGWTSKQ